MNNMIKGIIYDMDDVMVDSYPLCYKASKEVLNNYNFSLDKIPERVRAGFLGMRVIDVAKIIVNYAKLDLSPEEYFNKFTSVYDRIRVTELTTLPGLIGSLSLFKQENFKIALGSSGIKSYIDFVLDKFNLRSYFDAIAAGDQVKKGKPDPEVYLLCAGKLGLKAEECVVFEDAAIGIAAAKAAGCKCVAIINHHTPPQDLSQADLKINSLEEVNLDLIKSLEII